VHEMLIDHYEWNLTHGGNGGHLVGFYSKMKEKIASEYLFPKGKFTLRSVEKRFCRLDYDPFPA